MASPSFECWRAQLASQGRDRLFFAGDLGQRIFQEPFSWAGLGIDVRGALRNVEGELPHFLTRSAARSIVFFHRHFGTSMAWKRIVGRPYRCSTVQNRQVILFDDENAEIGAVARIIDSLVADGVEREQIGVFVRSPAYFPRAVTAAERHAGVTVETMHLAKGLEFRAVIVMACDENALPLADRVEAAQDERELDGIFETERQLLYVACTRARDRLFVTAQAPGSEYLADIEH